MKICIDPGHGGFDPGAVDNGLREADITLNIALKMKQILIGRGEQVILTRESDVAPNGAQNKRDDLIQRVKIANSYGADVFISIHINSFEDPRANGCETFYYSAKGKELAVILQKEQLKVMKNRDRGVKFANFYVIKYTKMPSALAESGFLANPTEAQKYRDENLLRALAEAYSNGLMVFLKGEKAINTSSIADVQKKLNTIKVSDAMGRRLVEDGISGTSTRNAIDKFQSIIGVNKEGKINPQLLEQLNEILSSKVIKRGMISPNIIRYIQYRIGEKIDGIFGVNTENAVKLWQMQNGLKQDGIIGKETWNKFFM